MKTTGTPEQLASLYRRMAQAMAHLKRLPKRGRNDRFNYDYVTDSDVLDAVRGAMGAAGIGFFADMVDIDFSRRVSTRSGEMTITELTIDAMFADGETGATVTVTWVGEAMDGQDKGLNKALTAAVKYGLLKTFLMSTGEDDPDDEAAEDKGNGHKAEAAKPAKHWIEDPKVRARFWAWTGQTLSLTNDQIHEALGVPTVKDFTGTMEKAKAKIQAWADSHAAIDAAVAEVYGEEPTDE